MQLDEELLDAVLELLPPGEVDDIDLDVISAMSLTAEIMGCTPANMEPEERIALWSRYAA